jgi:hypothetical protein
VPALLSCQGCVVGVPTRQDEEAAEANVEDLSAEASVGSLQGGRGSVCVRERVLVWGGMRVGDDDPSGPWAHAWDGGNFCASSALPTSKA